MRQVSQTIQFKRDLKRLLRRGKDLEKLKDVIRKLAQGEPLAASQRDHPLTGPWRNSRDCHIEPDWVLIYTLQSGTLLLERTGTHTDLFE